ncbi:TPA: hypothetical protein I9742_001528 [Serratia marcescens]|nr:hypothetical protein [Serratia marcescens]
MSKEKREFSELSGSMNKVISRLGGEINSSPTSGGNKNGELSIAATIKLILQHIHKNESDWNNKTSYCKKWHWLNLKNEIEKNVNNEEILSSLYPFLLEHRLTSEDTINSELKSITYELDENYETLPDKLKNTIETLNRNLMFDIYRERLSDEKYAITERIIDSCNSIKEFDETWEKKIKKTTEEIKSFDKKLEKIKQNENLNALKEALSEIKKDKELEKRNTFATLCFIGFSLTLAISLEITSRIKNWIPITDTKDTLLILIPFASLIILILYFFRITLHNYQSLKTQIIQIEWREKLCSFIQIYVEFKKEKHTAAPEAFDSFERLIFSNMTTHSKTPSPYDGIEPLIALMKEVRKLNENQK